MEGLTNGGAVIAMITTMLGTGVTFMPCAFRSVGYLNAVILLILCGMATFFSCYCITTVARHSNQKHPTYSSLASSISMILEYVVKISIFFNGYVAGINFYRFLSDLITKNSGWIGGLIGYPEYLNNSDEYEMVRRVVVLLLAIPFMYLSLRRTFSGLAFTSYLSVISVSYLSFLMMYLYFTVGDSCVTKKATMMNTSLDEGIPFFISCMVCQANIVKVYAEMRNKSNKDIIIVSLGAVVGGILINGLTGLFGYLVFGGTIKSEILSELSNMNNPINEHIRRGCDKNNIMSRMAIYGIILTLFGGYPVQVNPVSDMIFTLIPIEKRTEKRRRLVAIILFLISMSLSLVQKLNTKTIKTFLGATFSNSIAFVYPFVYYLNMRRGKPLSILDILSIFMIVLSVSVTIFTLIRISVNGVK